MKNKIILLVIGSMFYASGCAKKKQDQADLDEMGQQIGDLMASIDESSGSDSGNLAKLQALESAERTFARLAPSEVRDIGISRWIIPKAYASSCRLLSTFSSCSSNVVTRTFDDCTIGEATFSGSVRLTFSDAAVDSTCLITAPGHSISRDPDFGVTGRRGAKLTVQKTGTAGQVITKKVGPNFSFSNDGIRRKLVARDSTLFDFTTRTTADISISGVRRDGRVMNGGSLRVTNNLSGESCDYAPSSITWSDSCTCAVSGSWSGTCADGKSTEIKITGCGTAELSVGNQTVKVEFDRCYAI